MVVSHKKRDIIQIIFRFDKKILLNSIYSGWFYFLISIIMKISFCRRFPIAIGLWLGFGIFCTYLASTSTPEIWWTAMMWLIIVNRMTIGLVIGLVGVYTKHPIFGFPTPPILRGAIFGAIISLSLAIWIFTIPPVWPYSQIMLFWLTVGAGAVYGSIIDMISTWFGGQWKELLWRE